MGEIRFITVFDSVNIVKAKEYSVSLVVDYNLRNMFIENVNSSKQCSLTNVEQFLGFPYKADDRLVRRPKLEHEAYEVKEVLETAIQNIRNAGDVLRVFDRKCFSKNSQKFPTFNFIDEKQIQIDGYSELCGCDTNMIRVIHLDCSDKTILVHDGKLGMYYGCAYDYTNSFGYIMEYKAIYHATYRDYSSASDEEAVDQYQREKIMKKELLLKQEQDKIDRIYEENLASMTYTWTSE